MKFTKSSIFALGAVFALAFTACSDDDKYEVGKASHGAYFGQDLPTNYQISPDETDIANVPVYRVDTDSPTNYQLTVSVTPPTDGINIPNTVTFQGTSLSTSLPITYDPAKVEIDTPYTISLSIVGASDYGAGTYSFTFTCGDKAVTEVLGDGLATYYYGGMFFNAGPDPDLPVTHTYVPGKKTAETINVEHWGYDKPFKVTLCNDVEYTDGTFRCYVPAAEVGYRYQNDGYDCEVLVADAWTYRVDILGFDPVQQEQLGWKDASYFDPETGTFSLYVYYFLEEAPQQGFGGGEEQLVLGKFGDYSVSVDFLGTFTDPVGSVSAMANVTSGADASAVKGICVAGSDVDSALDRILAGGEGVVDIAVGENVQAYFPVAEGGEHTIVVVSYDGDEAKAYDDCTFSIATGGGEASEWVKLGNANYADGWVVPAFVDADKQPISNLTCMWDVPIEQSKANPNIYRLVGIYGAAGAPSFIPANNDYPKYATTRPVEIGVYANNFVQIDPQECGYGFSDYKGEFLLNNPEGFYYVNNVADGVTREEIAAFMESKDIEASSFDDGVFYIAHCWFGAPGLSSTAYSWNNPQPGIIVLPGAGAPAKNRVKAARIAAPKVKGLAKVASQKLHQNDTKMLISTKADKVCKRKPCLRAHLRK